MRRINTLALVLGIILAGKFNAQEVGTNAFTLLRTGYGASLPAIGGTGTAWTHDASNMWWNPAGLEGLSRGEVMLGYRSWLASIHDEFMGFAWPWQRASIGVAAFYSLTAVETWDETNQPSGKVHPQSAVIDVAFAYSFQRGVALGLGTKLLYENLTDAIGTGAVFDAGLWWQPLEWMSIGVALHDIGPGITYAGDRVKTPWAADAGLSLRILPSTTLSVSIGGESDAGFEARAGIEVMPHELIALRVGSRFNATTAYWGFWAAPTAGIGLFWKDFRVDYALVPYGPLGVTHSICISRYLNERPSTADVLVKVINSQDSTLLVAELQMSGAVADTLETLGYVRRNWLDPGEFKVKAEAQNYLPGERSLILEPARLNIVLLALDSIPGGILKGIVMEQGTRRPTQAAVFFKGETEDSVESDPSWGTYQSNPLFPGEYLVKVIPREERLIPSIYRVDVTPCDTINLDLYVSQERRADVLMTIYLNFETGKADLLAAHAPILDSIAPALAANADRGLRIEIAGHTDNVPVVYCPFGDNQRLSEARAESIRTYLVEKHGLSEKMFVCKGYGESEPLTSNETPEGRAMNRRIEFRLLAKDE
ncbi:PorV/PorQ family protein [candidate division WOR-3 bacterium]|nr:PorV/PorQ family protein [candidate division WOR-3 bacterium]